MLTQAVCCDLVTSGSRFTLSSILTYGLSIIICSIEFNSQCKANIRKCVGHVVMALQVKLEICPSCELRFAREDLCHRWELQDHR